MSTARRLAVPAAVAVLLAITGCTPTVPMEAAPDAVNPACASVIVRLPAEVGGLELRETNAQATGAWGDPAAVLLTCGVPVPPPTSEFPCFTFGGVDWLIDDSNAPIAVATTYGRDPAIQVVLDGSGGAVLLEDLARAVAEIEPDGYCLALTDTP